MERLTLVVPDSGEIWLLDSDGKPYSLIVEGEDRYDEIKRLSEYEDIGLLPEQIIEVDRLYAEKCKELAELQKNNQWIPCSERLPEEHDSIFAEFKNTDKWNNAMFEKTSNQVNATVEFEDGKRTVKTLHTVDGRWNEGNRGLEFKVIAWQPLPEAYQEPI